MSRESEERWLATITHGRYLVDLAPGVDAPLLVGFHGYGENAERHLEKLRRIPGAGDWLLCAVSALHHFYNTKNGDVIGSWMTSQGREQAIDDNVGYVSKVIAEVRRRYRPSDRLVYAGFSQGVAMAYRAAVRGGFSSHGLIALAGDVPPDVAGNGHQLPSVLLGRGVEDPLYTDDKMAADLEVLRRLDVPVETCVFEGGHDWTPEFWDRAGEFLRQVASPRGRT